MTDELKMVLVIGGFLTIALVAVVLVIAHGDNLDAAAPVVETCIKHPVTVSPFKPNY